ncbi:family with sequence similarity 161 member A [Nothobranchius furzeri]|uniref:Protein FAM161A n=3 Tax=Nothobranchius TaxID=28779 RepID=A0A9D3BNV9_NOTFU|nr:family with sequence similarity 161 member A [Nothobranchius furzeri]
MANSHRRNVLVTSCLKTPVDPNTKAPLASYERGRASASGRLDNRDCEKELEYQDSESDFCEEDCVGKTSPHMRNGYTRGRPDLSEIFFSNEEYYSKLEELKKTHLSTMAKLENMYGQKLQFRPTEPIDGTMLDAWHRFPWENNSSATTHQGLKKSHSAVELRWGSGQSDSSDETSSRKDVGIGLLLSPKEVITNMWKDFKVPPHNHWLTSSTPCSPPVGRSRPQKRTEEARQGSKDREKHRATVPKPFHMTLREDARQKCGVKTRSEMELENTNLRRQLEELSECQRKFRASSVPAHVRLPLYEELQERNEERRRAIREREQHHLQTIQKPFSFLERERLKKEQKQQQLSADQEKAKPFKAKPVPKSVYAAASGEQMKEEQLYRSIKIQMRAQEMLNSASLPPSMLTRRPSERKKTKDGSTAAEATHQPQINKEVPDFKASHKRFQKQLERRKEVKPITACEPFQLKTSQISCHRERILADIEKDRSSPRMLRWPYISPGSARTPSSSLCSSLSGSMELLPAKATDATKKRHEAVRYHIGAPKASSIVVEKFRAIEVTFPGIASRSLQNCFLADQYTLFPLKSPPLNLPPPTTTIISPSRKVLEQRKKAEEEEQRWRDKQKQREKKMQRLVLKRAQANDPHQALSQIYQGKLQEFRKQDLQRKKEYKQEIRDMCERVKGRPLLLEQVAQRIAKQAAEKRYIEALHGSDVTEDFLSSKVGKPASDRKASVSSDSKQSNQEDADYKPVRYRKIFLDDEDIDDPAESKGRKEEESDMASLNQDDEDHSPDDYHGNDCSYSDGSFSEDVGNYSDDSEHEADVRQQKVGE